MDETFYVKDGVKFARVTTVLGLINVPGLNKWRGRLGNTAANKVMRDAQKLGTWFHGAVEKFLTDKYVLDVKTPEQENLWKAWLDWYGLQKLEPVAIEETVYSEKWRVAGTPDLVNMLPDGTLEVLDWKTSSRFNMKHKLQAMAYAAMVMETRGVEVSRVRVVRFDKVIADWEEHVFEYDDECAAKFFELSKFWWYWNELEGDQ